jgi:hypothetical protein
MHLNPAPSTRSPRAPSRSPTRPVATAVLVLAAGLLAVTPEARAQPIGDWYGTMSNFGGARKAHIIGGVFGMSAAVFQFEGPIAVAGDVRTMGFYANGGGALYSLAGNPLGPTYTHPASLGHASDGTTDGAWNYTVDRNTGNVYQLDRSWQSPTLMFNVGPSSQGGITYDCLAGTLWVAGEFGTAGAVTEYTLGGTPLSSAVFTNSGYVNDLAMDTDGTFWAAAGFASGTVLVHYDRFGSNLGQFAIDLGADDIRGAEIRCVPAPAGAALLGLGALGALGRRRRGSRS